MASSAVDSGSGVEKADSERARQRRGRDEDEGHRVYFANRSIITAKTSEYKDHTKTERQIDEVNVPGSGWLARAERGRRQRSTTTKGCLRRQTRGSRGREGQPCPWLTNTQEHPVQAPARHLDRWHLRAYKQGLSRSKILTSQLETS